MHTTSLRTPWLLKTSIFFFLLLGFGVYGLYDATISYPERGRRFAEFCEWQYLQAASAQGPLDHRDVASLDPHAEYQRLLANPPTRIADAARFQWLRALSVIGRLDDARMVGEAAPIEPRARLDELTARWTTSQGQTRSAPKRLNPWDIPIQWLFVVVGFGGAAYLGALFIRVRSRVYTWDPEAKRLTLPDGATLTPEDIEDFDKRKWDKFLVFLKIKPERGGREGEICLDLYRYARLEDWVLEMERIAFPERAAPDPEQAGEPATDQPEAARTS